MISLIRVCLALTLCSIAALIGVASLAVPTPRGTLPAKDVTPAKAAQAPTILPPYETPVYAPPPNDGVALSSLLEASGYSGAATGASKSVAAGNFCGDAQKEIFVVTNRVEAAGRPPHSIGVTSTYSLLQGRTPNFLSNLAVVGIGGDRVGQWRAAAAANLDPSQPYDQIVLIRPNTDNPQSPNLAVLKVFSTSGPLNQNQCAGSSVLAQAMVGDIHSPLAGAAVGNFDGTGKKRIAMLDSTHSSIALVEMNKIDFSLNVVFTQALDGDLARPSEWNALVAGDIDHDGVDELIGARHISDNRRPTVVAFKWNGSKFVSFATSSFGNNGNSEWVGAVAADFNTDGRYAIVLVKNKHSNFAVLDLPPDAPNLQVRTTADLDSVEGQPWASLAATDWLSGDQGAAELIAFRGVRRPYRTNFFVYGNPFHRVSRDTGLEGTKAQWIQHLIPGFSYFTPEVNDLKAWISGTHTNVFNWFLGVTADPPNGAFSVHDYAGLVKFLSETKNWGVDGKQLRVWVTLNPPRAAQKPCAPRECCSLPEDTRPMTSWNALDYFKGDFSHDYDHLSDDDKIAACRDMDAWAAVIGRLAQDFPHLVALGIDDFSDSLDSESSPDCVNEFHSRMQFSEDCIAVIESRLRAQAPWLNFVPTVYYDYFRKRFSSWADLGLTLDSMQFFFRNEKNGVCIDHTLACMRTVENAPDEIRDMHQLLPSGRKLQLGIYFVGCQACSTNAAQKDQLTPPQIRYDYDLVRIGLNMPVVGGVTAYGLQTPPWCKEACGNQDWMPCTGSQCAPSCTEYNFLDDTVPPGDADPNFYTMWGTDRYCALQKAYGAKPQIVTYTELTPTGPNAASNPSAYFDPTDGTHHVIYRGGEGHVHELWWTSGSVGQGDLIPNGPTAVGDPASYFVAADGTQHVIYRSPDGHLHELWWVGPGSVGQGDLTPNGPTAVGDPSAYFLSGEGTQHVIYRSSNGHLHELWWAGPGSVGQGDLTPNGPAAASDPSSYFVDSDSSQHVIYRSQDGHLHELWWVGPGSVGQGDLTPTGPSAVGDPSGYFSVSDNMQHVIFRSGDGHLHELWWVGPGSVGQGDITPPEVASPAQSNPSAYFVALDGTNHVVYRSQDGHLHELSWTKGVVTHNDLTALVGAPNAVGDPLACYFTEEGIHHVFYRSGDGHLNELRWSN